MQISPAAAKYIPADVPVATTVTQYGNPFTLVQSARTGDQGQSVAIYHGNDRNDRALYKVGRIVDGAFYGIYAFRRQAAARDYANKLWASDRNHTPVTQVAILSALIKVYGQAEGERRFIAANES